MQDLDLTAGVPADSIADGQIVAGRVGDQVVPLVRIEGEFYAVRARCTHYRGPLRWTPLVMPLPISPIECGSRRLPMVSWRQYAVLKASRRRIPVRADRSFSMERLSRPDSTHT